MWRTKVVYVVEVVLVFVHLKVDCRKRRPTFQCAKLPRSTPLQIEKCLAVIVESVADWNFRALMPSIFHFASRKVTRPSAFNILSRGTTDRRGVAFPTSERGGAMIALPCTFGGVVVVC